MKKSPSQELLDELGAMKADLYVSLYMPTHRVHPENLQDPLRFKELVKKIDQGLQSTFSADQRQELLKPFFDLQEDYDFWQHIKEGLAVFATEKEFIVVLLENTVKPLTILADSFHIKPIRKYLQTLQRYQVLGLSQKDVQFYQGNRHALEQVPLAEGVPRTIKEALGDQLTQKYLNISTAGAAAGNARISHGHGSKSDEVEKDTERFFTVVARAIEEHYSRPSKLPLILVALPEHHSVFQKVSNNPCLLPKGVGINPKSVSIEKLKDLVWEVMEPAYFAKLEKLGQQYTQAQANGNGSDTLTEVARAAAQGKINTLLLEEDREIRGRIDRETGEIIFTTFEQSEHDDLLDDIGELVVSKGGKVVVAPKEKMPTFSGLAAIFRY